MVIAEDLLLLAFDDDTGKPISGVSNLELSLAGALLIELAMLGRVGLAVEGESVKKGRLVLRDSTPTGHPALDDALDKLGKLEGRKPQDAIRPLSGDDLSNRLLAGLADRGILRREQGRVLGIFPTTRWPAEESRHEEEVRAGLRRVLVDGGAPTEREAAMIALLSAMKLAGRVVDAPDRKLVERRAKEIAEGNWVSDAMGKVTEEITTAVMVAVFVPTIVSTTS
ncbi:Golgi phosphoprotein 3 (GPP34) [Amycolatopsis arida]|uniref:Golgi phosphoprotein 3 (GPP34) n=1 Tax=Amycolatopsis arida TaxID=587909 RepID=A0A1I5UPM1_9PSEU|nr:GPP34 family phosphoprotein [Amycolatopsis arida]TDX90984.1 Golgi phosphoprotein 3 GPP34 [Amycolatopsis arida]SFP97182.1 Golgi phosphoprotein 3 (GPP34) [Amycolatopsis arida]